MIELKREKTVVLFLLVIVLILACCTRFVISAETNAEAVPFDEKSVNSWSSDFTKFEGMKIDDINGVWEKADSQAKLDFLNSYVKDSQTNPQNLQLEGLDDKSLKFSKSETNFVYGDGSTNINLKELPHSLGKVSYSQTTAQEAKSTLQSFNQGDNKFTLEFSDGSKVNVAQGEVSKLDVKNPGQFSAYNSLHFKGTNGQEADLYTNGKYSDVEVNKDGKITFLGNSAVQTGGSDAIRSTISKPLGQTQDASVKMIDDSHIQVRKTTTQSWFGQIKTSWDPEVQQTDLFLDDRATDSKQFIQMFNDKLSLTGNDINVKLNDDAKLNQLQADGNKLAVDIYGIPVSFNGKDTSVPSRPVISFTIPQSNSQRQIVEEEVLNRINSARQVDIINSQDPMFSSQVSIKGRDYTLYNEAGELGGSNILERIFNSGGPLVGGLRQGTQIYITPSLDSIKRIPHYENTFKYPSAIRYPKIGPPINDKYLKNMLKEEN